MRRASWVRTPKTRLSTQDAPFSEVCALVLKDILHLEDYRGMCPLQSLHTYQACAKQSQFSTNQHLNLHGGEKSFRKFEGRASLMKGHTVRVSEKLSMRMTSRSAWIFSITSPAGNHAGERNAGMTSTTGRTIREANMGHLSTQNTNLFSTNRSTLENSFMSAVGKPLDKGLTSNTREFTLEKSLMSAISVGTHSAITPSLQTMKEFTLEKGLMNTLNVGMPSAKRLTLLSTREFTLAKSRTSAANVGKSLVRCSI